MSDIFQLSIRTVYNKVVSNNPIYLNANNDTTIMEIKQKLCIIENIPIEQQRIVFMGMSTESNRTLSDYNINKDSQLYLLTK
jgi:hypothetical protein